MSQEPELQAREYFEREMSCLFDNITGGLISKPYTDRAHVERAVEERINEVRQEADRERELRYAAEVRISVLRGRFLCNDDFGDLVCELPKGHAGNHQMESEAGTHDWSDPISGDTPDGPMWDLEDDEDE